MPASDVSAWAKAATKPTYTATEVGLGSVPNLLFSGSNTGDETVTTIKSKLSITTLSGSNTGDQTSVSGNAGTVTGLTIASGSSLGVSGGDVVLVGGGGGINITYVPLTVDVTNSTTTVSDVTNFSVPLLSGGTYLFRFRVSFFTALYSTGIFFALNGPAFVANSFSVNYQIPVAANAIDDPPVHYNVYNTPSDANTVGGVATPQIGASQSDSGKLMHTEITGTITPSASGNLILRFRSEVAGSTVTVKAGSLIESIRVI